MARGPKQALRKDGDARRTAVLEAALELFATRGYVGASARAITAHAKANVAAIKYYFGDKAGLYHAALALAHERMLESMPSPEPPGEALEPEAALRAWVERRLRMAARVHLDDQLPARLLMRAATEAGSVPGIEDFVERGGAEMRAQLERLLEALAPEVEPEVLARASSWLLLFGTHISEDRAALARFGLALPSEEDEFEVFFEQAWTFLRGGVLALLALPLTRDS